MLATINAVQLHQVSSELRHYSLFLVVSRARTAAGQWTTNPHLQQKEAST